MNTSRMVLVLALSALFAAGCAPMHKTIVMRGELVPVPSDGEDPELVAAGQRVQENFDRVFFEFDSATLTPESKRVLRENAEILVEHPKLRVRIEGHTDEAGSDEYNLALGDRRAFNVWNYLITFGVPEEQLNRVSLGEFAPAVKTGEVKEPLNRRAEFVVTAGDTEVRGTREL